MKLGEEDQRGEQKGHRAEGRLLNLPKLAPACLRRFLAFWRTLRAFLPGVVAARSMRVSALRNLPVTLGGMV